VNNVLGVIGGGHCLLSLSLAGRAEGNHRKLGEDSQSPRPRFKPEIF